MPACGPWCGSTRGARTTHLHQQALKTLARGQASRGGRHKISLGAASPGWLARGGEIKARQTSRGSRDVSHDDRDQAGASARSVLVSPFVLRKKAQAQSTEASSKGFHNGTTRPRPGRRQDGGHHGAQGGVTARAFCRRRLLLSAKDSISVQRDQDQQDGRTEVTMEPKAASPPEPFVGKDFFCQDKLY